MNTNLCEIIYWHQKRDRAIFHPAMDGSLRNRDENDGLHNGAVPYCADDIYEQYVEFCQESRAALLRVTLSPQSRESLSEESIALSKEEFLNKLQAMSGETRRNFIRRITSGYEISKLIAQDLLLRKYRPAA